MTLTTKQREQQTAGKRLDWLRRKHDKAVADYHFANGYRAGLECALLAIRDGRDVLWESIDDDKAVIR
jgi:hypothetical protein